MAPPCGNGPASPGPGVADAGRLRVGIDVRALRRVELSGVGRYCLELTRALVRRPLVEVVALSDGVPAHDLPVAVIPFGGASEVVGEQVGLARAARQQRLDVLLAPANRGLPWAAPCATVLTLHDTVEWDRTLWPVGRGRSWGRLAYSSVLSLAGADLVVTDSEASAAAIRRRLRVSGHRLRVIPLAAPDGFELDPGDDAVASLCARLGVERGFLLYLGGFDLKEDVATLLRAFARIVESIGCDLVIAGAPSSKRSTLEDLAISLGITDRVHWVGFVPEADLSTLYRGASCFAFPPYAEGFGLPVVEAMACEVPVVAARAAALPEVVSDGAVLVAPGDDRAWADALVEVLHATGEERVELAGRARRRVAALSWTRTAQETEGVLREAAAMSNVRRGLRRVAGLGAAPWRIPPWPSG